MKFSLISATSIIALFSAAVGPAQAAVLSAATAPLNIYDLVRDGVTSSDGGDNTVAKQDLSVSAAGALVAAINDWRPAGFTGQVDRPAAMGKAVPETPLGAARGTKRDDDLASSDANAGQWNAFQKARAVGQLRMASLIGTIGNGAVAKEKSGGTVFVAASNLAGFNDGSNVSGGARGSSGAYVFAPGSTSTATITVAGAGSLSRQGSGGGFYAAAANSLQVAAPAGLDATRAVASSDTAQPTLGYNYAPPGTAAAKANSVAASFSDAVTATGLVAQRVDPTAPAKIQTSQVQPGQRQPDLAANGKIATTQAQSGPGQTTRAQTVDATTYGRLLDLSRTIQGPRDETQVDGTRSFISTSVSANPSASAARVMANIVNTTRTGPAAQSVEAFQVGPSPGPKAQATATTTVSDPLHGKIMASAGPLNNSLALP